MKKIKVYGAGCKRCETTEPMIRRRRGKAGRRRLGRKGDRSARSIAMAGVMSTPGISIDGKLVHTGGLPDTKKLDSWLNA